MRIETATITTAILLKSPGWARVGITAPEERLRNDAAQELARVIAAHLDGGCDEPDPNQLALGL